MKWRHRIEAALSAWLIVAFLSVGAGADDYHYRNLLVGSRATGLGGAYTALADDTAGCYYNPAGIALAPGTSISASMNAYQKSIKTYKGALQDTSGNKLDWEQDSSSLLPNFFGVVKKVGVGMLGLSYAVPDSIQRRQDQTFYNVQSSYPANPVDQFIINIDDTDTTYLFGPSYGVRIMDNLSIGATVYVYYRDKQIIRNQVLLFHNGEHYWSNYYDTQNDWGYRPMVGLIWEPLEKLSLGLTFAKTYVASSDRRQQELMRDTTDPAFADTDALRLSTTLSDETNDFPLTTTLGAAYFVSPRMLFAADVAYYEAVGDKEAVWNLSVGTEYYVTDNLALSVGLFTDMANTPELNPNMIYQPEHVDIYGLNMSVSFFHGHSSITVGGAYGYGRGDAQVVSRSTTIQDVDINNYALSLAAAYSF